MVHSEEELKMLVTASQEAGVLEEREEQMLHRVFGFADLTAAQIMLPRTELVAIAADSSGDAMLDEIARAGYPTLPVYQSNLDNVIGILHVTDVIQALAAGDRDKNAGALAREALTVPETIPADDLLVALRRKRVREAIVIDEYGGTAGLVTIEDILEVIVGDIRDEYDREEPAVVQEEQARFWVSGFVSLADLSELLGVDFEREDLTTVGGLVYDAFGRVPRPGETKAMRGFKVVVERVRGRRIERVYFERVAPGAP
jgi:CBS domain containing-hemolysin-like protein